MNANKIGIFGGAFDPIHFGHLNSISTIAERLELDAIKLIPNFRGPLRPQTQGATPEQRIEMCRLAVKEVPASVEVDGREIERGGVSYTIDTLKDLQKQNPGDHFFLIIGLDQFNKFDEWKNFDDILKRADLVVTSRPGMEFPYSVEKMPPGIRPHVVDFDGRQALLKGGRAIHFVPLQDVEASATEIRKKIRLGQTIQHLIPHAVSEYIKEHHLYESVAREIGDFKKFTLFCLQFMKDKGGIHVRAFDLKSIQAPAEFSVIASGTSTRHATALAETLVKEVKREYGVWPQSIEGQSEGRWIVIDYGALIIHAFYDFVRHEYRLEELWKNAAELQQ